MTVDGLRIPELLEVMSAQGRWPRTTDEAGKQNSQSRVAEDRRRELRRICLYAPPFNTVASITAGRGHKFYADFGAPHELVPEAAIEIADFGLGSDTPIVLDYRSSPFEPRVIHLEWGDRGKPNYWVEMAPRFDEFVEMLGL